MKAASQSEQVAARQRAVEDEMREQRVLLQAHENARLALLQRRREQRERARSTVCSLVVLLVTIWLMYLAYQGTAYQGTAYQGTVRPKSVTFAL